MDTHLILPIVALLAAIASLIYTVRAKRSATNLLAMPDADRVCFAWNNEYPVGTWVFYEPVPFDSVKGRIAVRTLSKAYVKDGKTVIDVERFGSIDLNRQVSPT